MLRRFILTAACALLATTAHAASILAEHSTIGGLQATITPTGTPLVGLVFGTQDVTIDPILARSGNGTVSLAVPGPCGTTDAPDVFNSMNGSSSAAATSGAGASGTLAIGHTVGMGWTARFLAMAVYQSAAGQVHDAMTDYLTACPAAATR